MRADIAGTRVLVTGGAGFIGSNLTDYLLEQGAEVTVLDNFSTGKPENLAAARKHSGFRLIEGDIRDPEACAAAVASAELVVHLAALGSVPRSIRDPGSTVAVNVGGFVNVLFAAAQAGIARVVYASSSSVYGDAAELPKVESRTGKPLSPYALSKAADELFAENFHTVYGLNTIGLRFFNVFGRRQDPFGAYAAVIPKFIKQLLAGEQPTINGDGRQSRDFTYVENVVEANLKACLAPAEASGEAFNIAYGGREYLIDIYHTLTKALGVDIEPHFGPDRKGDIKHSNADISKARRLLGYDPSYDFARGLNEAIAWYRENL